MARSQNGWSANDRTVVSRRQVPGTEVYLTVRNGAPGDLLLEVAAQFDKFVEDIDNARGALDDWAYAERAIRGSDEVSNHASGTAIDLNATRHPLGTDPRANFADWQIRVIRRIVADALDVVRWGGDYIGRKDPMHFELNDGTTEADCVRALAALRGVPISAAPSIPAPTPQKGDVMIDNFPVSGNGTLRLICPVGRASIGTGRAWLSAVTNGKTGTVRGWFQSDASGITDFSWTVGSRDGRSDRPWAEFPDGATQVNVQYSFPEGGCLALEAFPK